MTDEPSHKCAICHRAMATSGYGCERCEQRIDADLTAIPDLYALLPGVLERNSVNGPKVSGSREAPIPLRVDVVDPTLQARNATILDLYGDQTGAQSVATILDQWVRDWRDTLCPRESLPQPTVVELAQWLRNRLPTACDQHPAIDEAWLEFRALVRTLTHILGRGQRSGEYIGRCPTVLRDDTRCGTRLTADPYVDRIVCGRCGSVWPRYEWLHLAALQQDMEEAS